MKTFEMTIECNEDNMDHFENDLFSNLREIAYLEDWEYDYDEDTTEIKGFFDSHQKSLLIDYSKMVSKECRAKVNLTCYDGYGNYLSFSFKNGKVA